MKNIVNTYLDRFRRERRMRIQFILILLALAVMVVGLVFWRLHYIGVALTDAPSCGITEHVHTEDCYVSTLICGLEESEGSEGHTHTDACYDTKTEIVCGKESGEGAHIHTDACYTATQTLTCGLEESEDHTHTDACYTAEKELTCGLEESEGHIHTADCYESTEVLVCRLEECAPTEGHVHTADCYEQTLVCGLEEHTHTLACMSDGEADTETKEDWEATLPDEDERTGIWREDVVTIARSQIGYHESTRNFILDEDGNQKGYTRYGAWYGNAYGDWCAMFASWCIHYAGIDSETFPYQAGCYAWTVQLGDMDLYHDTDYLPQPGDLIFFDNTGDGRANHVGIVEKYEQNGEEIDCETLTAAPEGEEITLTDLTLYTIEGNSGNQVKENHYALTNSQILGYGELPTSEKIYTAEADGVTVTVNAPRNALPDDAELSAVLCEKDSQEYAKAAEAIGADGNLAVLDVSFVANGKEVEPSEPVQVTLDASALVPENAENIVIQHLEETKDGVEPEVVATLSTPAKAEFEVESFSVFTVEWNDGTTDTIEVHVYNMNGTSINETLDEDSALIANDGTITISELADHLEASTEYIGEYTFRYATVYYETAQTQGASYDPYTIGSESASVTQISKSGTTYTVSYGTDLTATVSSPYVIEIHLYYSIPTVTISATDEHSNNTVSLQAEGEYFQGLAASDSNVTYTWSLSDGTVGSITEGNTDSSTAAFTWSSDAQSGDQVTITVTMTNTYTDENGNEVTETASDTYTLTYGEVPVTVTVTAASGTGGQENAHVALVDSDGNTVATGTTDSDGNVTLYAVPGTYTVGVTYVYQSSTTGGGQTTRYTTEVNDVTIGSGSENTTTVSLSNITPIVSGPGGDTSGSYGGGSEPYYYEHIDVKVAAASTENTSVTFSDLDAVYVYDKYGNLIYYSDDLVANEGTTDYNCLFDINGAEDTHSIVVSSEDTIVIVYEVTEDGVAKTYTLTMAGDGKYPEGEYYAYTDINAYQLYNSLYNGSYASQEAFAAAWEAGQISGDGYSEYGIPIGGYSYSLVADYLCDTRTTSGQAGLDIVIDVEEADVTRFDFRIAKEFVGYPDNEDNEEETPDVIFTFTLTELSESAVSDNVWIVNEGTQVSETTGSTDSWTSGTDKNGKTVWSSLVKFEQSRAIEAIDGTYSYYFVLSESSSDIAVAEVQNYGIRVQATYSSATGLITLSVSYCELEVVENEDDEESTAVQYQTGNWMSLSLTDAADDQGNVTDSYYALPFVNTYRSETYSVDIFKYTSVEGEGEESSTMIGLSGAEFTLTQAEEGDESASTAYFSVETDKSTGEITGYTFVGWDLTEETEGYSEYVATLTSGVDGYIHIKGLPVGTYTLTETKAPDGYNLLDSSITFTIDEDGSVTVPEDATNAEVIKIDEGVALAVENNESGELPNTGGIGTYWYTTAGLLLITGAAYLLYKSQRKERGSRKI